MDTVELQHDAPGADDALRALSSSFRAIRERNRLGCGRGEQLRPELRPALPPSGEVARRVWPSGNGWRGRERAHAAPFSASVRTAVGSFSKAVRRRLSPERRPISRPRSRSASSACLRRSEGSRTCSGSMRCSNSSSIATRRNLGASATATPPVTHRRQRVSGVAGFSGGSRRKLLNKESNDCSVSQREARRQRAAGDEHMFKCSGNRVVLQVMCTHFCSIWRG